jgi:hypothetical protein
VIDWNYCIECTSLQSVPLTAEAREELAFAGVMMLRVSSDGLLVKTKNFEGKVELETGYQLATKEVLAPSYECIATIVTTTGMPAKIKFCIAKSAVERELSPDEMAGEFARLVAIAPAIAQRVAVARGRDPREFKKARLWKK